MRILYLILAVLFTGIILFGYSHLREEDTTQYSKTIPFFKVSTHAAKKVMDIFFSGRGFTKIDDKWEKKDQKYGFRRHIIIYIAHKKQITPEVVIKVKLTRNQLFKILDYKKIYYEKSMNEIKELEKNIAQRVF